MHFQITGIHLQVNQRSLNTIKTLSEAQKASLRPYGTLEVACCLNFCLKWQNLDPVGVEISRKKFFSSKIDFSNIEKKFILMHHKIILFALRDVFETHFTLQYSENSERRDKAAQTTFHKEFQETPNYGSSPSPLYQFFKNLYLYAVSK